MGYYSSCPVDGCEHKPRDYPGWQQHLLGEHAFTVEQLREAARPVHEQMRRDRLRDRLWTLKYGRTRMSDWTLDTFPADDVAGRRALEAARDWLRDWFDLNQPRLFVHGPPGTGKTGLAYGMARQWIEEDGEVVFENVRALLAAQRASFTRGERKSDDDEPTGIEKLLDIYEGGDGALVVLDDLGAERPTEFALETIALIIEHLHVEDVPLIVTTNYAPAALAKRLGHADLVVGQRIVSRLVEDALVIRLDRADLRTRKARPPTTDAGEAPAEGSRA
jgi:DNA replication protein DnaC